MTILQRELKAFASCPRQEDRSHGTVDKYLHDASGFSAWLGDRKLNKENAAAWRDRLVEQGYAPSTINSMLSAVNHLLKFLGREDCKIKFLRVQRKAFRDQNRELTRTDYQRLLDTAADQGQERLGLLMETICATGIRISEVQYITVEAAQADRAEVSLKGKLRSILFPAKLCRKLLKYPVKIKPSPGRFFSPEPVKRFSARKIGGR